MRALQRLFHPCACESPQHAERQTGQLSRDLGAVQVAWHMLGGFTQAMMCEQGSDESAPRQSAGCWAQAAKPGLQCRP